MNEIIAFLAGSAVLAWLSREAIRRPGRHGFYRFFAWEGILGLIVLNHEPWGEQPYSAHQLTSWLLMLTSLFLVIQGLRLLRRLGKADHRRDDAALYEFERTTALVTTGIFAYIRHPMYASLLALTWGAFFQDPSWIGGAIAAASSYCLLLTAQADERECLAYFGDAYADYMKRTRRFIPGLY